MMFTTRADDSHAAPVTASPKGTPNIDSELAKRIVLGIASEDAMLIAGASHALTFAHEPICLVTGVLRSPDVEHLAQHFATLFVRIGLEDHAKAVVDRHCSIVKVL